MGESQLIKARIFAIFRNLGTLALLAIAFPINCMIVFASLLWSFLTRPFQQQVVLNENSKNIMIVGARMTKTLQLARSFHAAGHRAIIVDTDKYWLSGNQFSNAVAGFYTVPDPQKDKDGYIEAMRAIAKQENIDLFIPVAIFAVIYFDFNDKQILSGCCESFHFDADVTRMLDDKFAFAETSRS